MTTELATHEHVSLPEVREDGRLADPLRLWLDPALFEHVYRIAKSLAASDSVPERFRGKPENCFPVVQMAFRCGQDPMMFLQNSYVIAGRPAIEAKLAIALLNASGKIRGSIKFNHDGKGKDRSCTAYAVEAATGEVIEETLHWATVESEGWVSKKGSKWVTDPMLMLKYRSAMRLIRTAWPEVLMGMLTKEEAEELNTVEGRVESKPATQVNGRVKRLPFNELERPEPQHVEEVAVEPASDGPTAEELAELEAQEAEG